MAEQNILIVEDDKKITELLSDYLISAKTSRTNKCATTSWTKCSLTIESIATLVY